MKKLIFVLTAAILLLMTACEGTFLDPGMGAGGGGGGSYSGGGYGGGGGYGSGSGGGIYGGGGSSSKPATPTGVTATAIDSSSIRISWNAVSGAYDYNIYRSTSSSGPYTLVSYTSSTYYTNSYGLSPSTTYYYKVSAENSSGESALSAYVSATTLAGNTYTVTFDINGGSGTAPSPMTATSGTSITLPNGDTLSRTDCTFSGWNTNSTGTGTNYNAGASYTVYNNITLYAKWIYNGSGGEGSPLSLTQASWTNGSIASNTVNREVWYSFDVTNGTTYYVWWNDSYNNGGGDGTKTLDVMVSAYYSNGTIIFSAIDSGWNTARSFTANSTGTVKLRVYPYTTGNTGTFGITFTTVNSRPATP